MPKTSKKNRRGQSQATSTRVGPTRTPTQASVYRFVRSGNASNATGTVVDGTVVSKSATNLVITTGATANGLVYGTLVYYVALSDLPDYTDFTALFDQYRIDGVEVSLLPYCTQSATGAAYSATAGQTGVLVHSCIDYDDATAPTGSDAGIQKLREYQNYRVENLYARRGGAITFKWAPRIAVPAYQSGAFSGYSVRPFDWIDCNSDGVQGYGLKLIFEVVSSGIAAGVVLKAEVKAHLSFRNVR